jgi:uncharacterized protein YpmB
MHEILALILLVIFISFCLFYYFKESISRKNSTKKQINKLKQQAYLDQLLSTKNTQLNIEKNIL